jgi:replicative DNA helicase
MLNTEPLERYILGTMLLDSSLADEIVATMSPELFRIVRHRNLFKMFRRIREKGQEITLPTVITMFPNDLEKIGGVDSLKELAHSIPSANAVPFYMQQLIEFDARIRWNQTLEEYREKVLDPDTGSFEELLDEFEQKALDIRPKNLKKQSTTDSLIAWYENLVEKKANPILAFGMRTGWDGLDRLTLGFQRKEFFVAGGATSMGKSAFANEVKKRISDRGYKVADFSLEMSKEQIYNRLISNLTGISMQALRVGNISDTQLEKIPDAMEKIRRMNIDDERGVSVEYITSEMRRMKRQEGLDLVIVDYLQEIDEPAERNDNGGSSLKRICQKLRKAAKECDCHVLGLSQVKDDVNKRQNKRPTISDLAGSKSISDVADGIILLYRDDYYNPDTADKGIIELNLAKQRNGPTGVVKLHFDKDTQRISGGESGYVEQTNAI